MPNRSVVHLSDWLLLQTLRARYDGERTVTPTQALAAELRAEAKDRALFGHREVAHTLNRIAARLDALGDGCEVRENRDGSLDEVVGSGLFHLEQMSATHWWLRLGPHVVSFHSRATIKATVSRDEWTPDTLPEPPK